LLFLPLLYLRTRKNIQSQKESHLNLQSEQTSNKNRLFSAFANGGSNTDNDANNVASNPLQKYSTYDSSDGRPARQFQADSVASRYRTNEGDDQEANFRSDSVQNMLAPDAAMYFKSSDEVFPFHELRLYSRLSDKDLRYHAGRIYLDGINSPLSWMGGGWHWPLACPHSLLYGIHTKQYISFAQRVNDLMVYPCNGWEMYIYLFLLMVIPPYAEYFLLRRRLSRAKLLLNTLATVRNPFFKSNKSSLRLSIAPDLTIAYVDILIDMEFHQRAMKASQNPINSEMNTLSNNIRPHASPIKRGSSKNNNSIEFPTPGPLGQPKLPIFIRFCGMGTYFSPWYLDSNDLLLQAIPLANDVSVFIDKAFINFVYDFNKILKSLRRHCLKDDLIVLLKVC
jgi:hypothetical protein